ncbi:hypothetical protein [Serratia ficaria]|uniref:Uncharacterized protein n=1 Tax=Serratia ficaria TaxID=61651 RepID=A0A240BV65_SERFI|nr:hypothetical protein [Serratia ficaria]REF45216.1 hypothetical protein C7332_3542 [Serratia ficaria]CAI0870985.1 Uncharacterised protein [Serratia ficaria]CAI0909931.1 Uncharacterised protein [Serratia ficaria]CAI0922899.1 Uncharacterised protein [Serratia ficaria]CAI2006640.1 Uncharacterised protein [Serratia ficaria]
MPSQYLIPALLMLLTGCSGLHPGSYYPVGGAQPVTREQRQRIIGGESANAVLNEGRAGIGGTIDWSRLWVR